MRVERPAGSWIPWLFVAFLAIVLAANGTIIWYATRSWTGLTTEQAYDKGLRYNRNLEAARTQAALGWRARLTARPVEANVAELTVELVGPGGAPITGADVDATLERPTQDRLDFQVRLDHVGDGIYRASFDLPLAGSWQIHLVARRGNDLFVHDERVMLR